MGGMVTGMRDFLPKEKALREEALSVIRDTYRSYGFQEIETPALEDIDVLRGSDGGDNMKMTFDVIKRRLKPEELQKATSGKELVDLGLRFDLTVPLARFYADNKALLPNVFRSIQIAPVWRAERPQKGRFRQFIQCDIDVIGEAGSLAEIELVTVTAAILDALGVTGYRIRMNDRNLLNSFLNTANVPEDKQAQSLIILDKSDKISPEKIVEELSVLLEDETMVQALVRSYALTEEDELSSIIKSVNELAGKDIAIFDPTLIRGMGYYTGTIFEVTLPDGTTSVGGGGRYDRMIGRFLKTDIPAVGFSLGFERIVDLVELNTTPIRNIAIVYGKDVPNVQLLKISKIFIADGIQVRLVGKAKNTKKQLDDLKADGFTGFVFVNAGNENKDLIVRDFS